MTVYKSKIGLELAIPISLIIGGTGILMTYEKNWIGLGLIFIVITFIVHMLLTTYYTVDNNKLRVKCGFFFDRTIDLDTIKEIKETNNPISSPAISLDRLVISYNSFDTVIISPKNKGAFIKHLTGLNPNIKVTLKGNSKRAISTF